MRHHRFAQASRLLLVVLAAAFALMNAACGSPTASQPEPGTSQPDDQTLDLHTPGTVLILHCGSTSRSRSLTLTALSVDNGRKVAAKTAPMPDNVTDGGLPLVCGDPLGGYYPSPTWLALLLNRDYTQIAGWVRGPGGEGSLATAFDLRTGAQVGPGPNPDTFAASPDDGRPVFHEGKLWYVDRDKRLRSRAPEQALEAAQDHGPAPDSYMILAGGVPWYGDDAYTAVVHPSGGYAAEFNRFPGNDLRIRKRDADRNKAVVLSTGTRGDNPPPDSAPVPSCRPNFWLDDRTLICSSQSMIWKLTLAPSLGSVTEAEPLLPTTDRQTYGAILAPDKQAFAFLAEQGDTTAVYRQSLSPGAQPVKITDVPTSPASRGTYLLAWH